MTYLEQIDEMLLDFEPDDPVGENTHSDDENTVHIESSTRSSKHQKLHRLPKKTRTRFLPCIEQLPIVGSNSGFNDLNVIKPYLLKSLQRYVSLSSIECIKRNTSILLLSTPNLRFIDCSHFLPMVAKSANFLSLRTSHQL